MPFIGNGIKPKETGKSGGKTEFTSLFISFHKTEYKIGSGKRSLSTGPDLDRFFCLWDTIIVSYSFMNLIFYCG